MDEKDYHELASRIRDLSAKAASDGYLTHTAFLSASEQAVFYEVLREQHESSLTHKISGITYVLYGGHEDADRKVIYFLPYYMKEEELLRNESKGDKGNLSLLHVSPKNVRFADTLTHRDYLGALMHLGFDRSMFGDILTDGTEGYIYILRSVAEMVKAELCKVKHTVVDVEKLDVDQCPLKPHFEEKGINVASIRLDTVLAEIYHLSRKDAQVLIASENVFVDGRTMKNNSYPLKENERVSVAGKGKFIYLGQGKITRKGRFFVKVKIYD
jgi:RNA-binding protein YlmH